MHAVLLVLGRQEDCREFKDRLLRCLKKIFILLVLMYRKPSCSLDLYIYILGIMLKLSYKNNEKQSLSPSAYTFLIMLGDKLR